MNIQLLILISAQEIKLSAVGQGLLFNHNWCIDALSTADTQLPCKKNPPPNQGQHLADSLSCLVKAHCQALGRSESCFTIAEFQSFNKESLRGHVASNITFCKPFSTLPRLEKAAISNRNKEPSKTSTSGLKDSFHRSTFLKAHNKFETHYFLHYPRRDYLDLKMNFHLKIQRNYHLEQHPVSRPERRKQSCRRSGVKYAHLDYPCWMVFEHGTAADYFPP